MKSNSKFNQLKSRKSFKILKTGIPILLIGVIIEYMLFLNHSSITSGSIYILIDLAYTLGMAILFLLTLLIICSVIALIIDYIELNFSKIS